MDGICEGSYVGRLLIGRMLYSVYQPLMRTDRSKLPASALDGPKDDVAHDDHNDHKDQQDRNLVSSSTRKLRLSRRGCYACWTDTEDGRAVQLGLEEQMLHIDRLPENDLDAFVDIVANAFVGMQLRTRQDKENFKERTRKLSAEEPTINLYGAWRDTKLVGGMRLFDWTMTLLSAKAAAGGVGLVAVDLMHKKEHVAKEMI